MATRRKIRTGKINPQTEGAFVDFNLVNSSCTFRPHLTFVINKYSRIINAINVTLPVELSTYQRGGING